MEVLNLMNFIDLTRKARKVPNIRVLSVCTLILLRHKEVSSYMEILYKVYDVYVDATNYELYGYFCKKLKEQYKTDLAKMSLNDINSTLENIIVNYCDKELNVAIAHGYLSELQEFNVRETWSIRQAKLIDFLISYFGNEFTDLINPSMSNRAIIYIATIHNEDKDLAKIVSEYTLSDDVLYQICLGSFHNINLFDYAVQGYSANDLAIINKASQLPGFNIDKMCEDGTPYPSLAKIRDFIINY